MPKPATSYKPQGWANVTMMLAFEDNKCAEAIERYKVRADQGRLTLHAARLRTRTCPARCNPAFAQRPPLNIG